MAAGRAEVGVEVPRGPFKREESVERRHSEFAEAILFRGLRCEFRMGLGPIGFRNLQFYIIMHLLPSTITA